MDVFLEITSRNPRCLECNTMLEADERDFCHECNNGFEMNGGVDMFDFAVEHSYGS